jgi:hypothetical protein
MALTKNHDPLTATIDAKLRGGGSSNRSPIGGYGKAPGRKADTGTPLQPAPTKTAPASVASSEKIAANSPGQSGYAIPASINPGQKLNALLEVSKDPEGVLASVQAKGVAMDGPDWQLRAVPPTMFPATHGAKRQQQPGKFGGDVPDKCG